MTPTSRTLAWCKRLGWTARVVEHWNPFAHIRQDLWGLDILALTSHNELVGIQCTSSNNVSLRRQKLDGLPTTSRLRDASVRILVIGWGKRGARGRRKQWEPTIHEATTRGWRPWLTDAAGQAL